MRLQYSIILAGVFALLASSMPLSPRPSRRPLERRRVPYSVIMVDGSQTSPAADASAVVTVSVPATPVTETITTIVTEEASSSTTTASATPSEKEPPLTPDPTPQFTPPSKACESSQPTPATPATKQSETPVATPPLSPDAAPSSWSSPSGSTPSQAPGIPYISPPLSTGSSTPVLNVTFYTPTAIRTILR